jgi:hypothetical protein
MDTLTTYTAGLGPVNSMPVDGQYLGRRRNWRTHEREFWAADLYRGDKHLVAPTLEQATFLTNASSITAVWWALQREQFRQEIMWRELPLTPPRPKKATVPAVLNSLVQKKPVELEDSTLHNIIAAYGVDRVLNVAAEVERAMHS